MMYQYSPTVLCSILLVCASLTSAQTNTPAADKSIGSDTSAARADDKYRIGYRDKLNVQVFKHPELAQTVSVNSNGTITLFKIPEPLVAVCKTERELANDIAAAYKKDYLRNPEVNVAAVEQMSQSLAVIGAVEKPGGFFVNRKVHLLELLAQAGGPSKEAGSRLLVFRPGSTSNCDQSLSPQDDKVGLFNFVIRDLQEGKQSFMMQPGDVVSVLPADIAFVYGNVNEQGQVVMKQPMTLTQVIASAKGVKPATQKDKVRIIRQKPGSPDPEVIVADLNAIGKQKAPDPWIQPNDIVALSEDRVKGILQGVGKSFTQGLPSLLYRPY
jgi:polysaccharide biosynthesis/export protein